MARRDLPNPAYPSLPRLDGPRSAVTGHACPSRASPAVPCDAAPGLATPVRACRALPCDDAPVLAMPVHACLVAPCLARTCHTCPRLPRLPCSAVPSLDPPVMALPRLASIDEPSHALPRRAHRAMPASPRQAMPPPGLASPCQSPLTRLLPPYPHGAVRSTRGRGGARRRHPRTSATSARKRAGHLPPAATQRPADRRSA